MTTYKTPVTILQEMMTRLGAVPEYQCVAQTGPDHLSLFEYECMAQGQRVRVSARSKKEAKQEAARAMLSLLQAALPSTSASPAAPPPAEPVPVMSYVALLSELCIQYGLPAAEYTLIGDTGPPHLRQFTVQASLGQTLRSATSSTKKAARQLAAQDLYRYLRENLSSLTSGFNETEALAKVHERVMERYVEEKGATPARDLSKRLDDCPRNIFCDLSEEKRAEILAIIDNGSLEPVPAAMAAATAAGVGAQWAAAGGAVVLRLAGGVPALAAAGGDRGGAARAALRLLRLAIHAP